MIAHIFNAAITGCPRTFQLLFNIYAGKHSVAATEELVKTKYSVEAVDDELPVFKEAMNK